MASRSDNVKGGPREVADNQAPLVLNGDSNADDVFQRSISPEKTPVKTPEPQPDSQVNGGNIPSTPGQLDAFDWEDFEARYKKALQEADEEERVILRQADNLSRYFRAWASAAAVHDDDRAVKRLQTRQRFVNLSEEKMIRKQQHYQEVVKAFESALALLRSQ